MIVAKMMMPSVVLCYLKLFDNALVLSLLCTDWPLLPPGWLSVSESTVMQRAVRFVLLETELGKTAQ
jgi:hypothetical protein